MKQFILITLFLSCASVNTGEPINEFRSSTTIAPKIHEENTRKFYIDKTQFVPLSIKDGYFCIISETGQNSKVNPSDIKKLKSSGMKILIFDATSNTTRMYNTDLTIDDGGFFLKLKMCAGIYMKIESKKIISIRSI